MSHVIASAARRRHAGFPGAKTVSELSPCPAIRVIMMPRDTNPHGTIFGGVLLSYIDQAGAVEARKHAPHRFVTIAMEAVEFKQPVYVGDILSFFTRVEGIGTSSIRVRVSVAAERMSQPNTSIHVTEATVVYVAVDEHGIKTAIVKTQDAPLRQA
jgi:acyl-CoA thioesterase YciA